MSLFLFLFLFLAHSSSILTLAHPHPPPPPQPAATRVTILGSVYCDACYDNTFSNHSYFLPGVDVNVKCKLKSRSPGSTEEISFSVNRTTNIYGMYAVDIPSVDCRQNPTVQSFCQATLIGRPVSTACSLPARKASDDVARQTNGCTYTIGALSFRPPRRNTTLCLHSLDSWNTSKFFLPYFPPYVFPWPQLPPLPPLPQLPPLPPLPPFPFPPNPPSLPFPFPSIPPLAPPSPGCNLGDPRSWIPQLPLPPPPPPVQPPVFNFWDPNTWIPHPPPKSR